MLDKNKKYLLILESPNKKSTVSSILKELGYSNVTVMASVGHITKINDSGLYNMGIDPKNNFAIDYVVSPEKKDIVSKLKEQVRAADQVILLTDPDREGEAIAYHLKEVLKIPDSKYIRCTTHEITKAGIQNALNNQRKLDEDLIDAAKSRSCADKIIGYRLSGIARNNVGAKSVGRCQSAGLKLIVQREEEILNFKPETYYDFFLNFSKNKINFTAKYIGTDKKNIKSLKSLSECQAIADECKKNAYSILKVEHKDSLENPKPPFITSTYQQEVSKKLGISVKYAMDCAQKLFEGIEISGKHVSLITYHRTDDPSFSPDFLPILKEYVEENFGKQYYAPVKAGKKGENAQEGHEGIRVVDLNMTPDRLAKHLKDERLLKVYTIIWRRTVACGMKPAIIANTIYTIQNGKHRFSMTSKELKFEGYRVVYNYATDEEESDNQLIKETFAENEILQNTKLEAIEKQTKPPARYSESSFIKELDKKGIGRPSTYATILGVLLDEKRGYCKAEDKNIVPTPLGIKLSHFLDDKFSDVISITYTAELEKELDRIANHKLNWLTFMNDFYNNLEENIKKVQPQEEENRICPNCGKSLKLRKGRYGFFFGCTGYPECTYIENIKK